MRMTNVIVISRMGFKPPTSKAHVKHSYVILSNSNRSCKEFIYQGGKVNGLSFRGVDRQEWILIVFGFLVSHPKITMFTKYVNSYI